MAKLSMAELIGGKLSLMKKASLIFPWCPRYKIKRRYSSDECLSQTNNLNWNAHAPTEWKISTIRSLVKRAFSISSTETALSHELSHLQKVFTTFNNYSNKVVNNIINTVRTQTVTTLNEEDQPLKSKE